MANTDSTYDAVVIGAGFAGAAAARELARAGLTTALIEARDRVGGRTWTYQDGDTRLELGGGWIHWHQPHMWAEITRYGIAIEQDELEYDTALIGQPIRRVAPAEAFDRISAGFHEYVRGFEHILPRPHEPLTREADIQKVDKLSMQDRLDSLDLNSQDTEWISGLLYEIAGSPLSEAGLLPVLRWLALCDWDVQNWYQTNVYRPAGGTAAVINAILNDTPIDTHLNRPVTAIRSTDRTVLIRTATGSTIKANAAVVAVPVNLWEHIDFDPPLPPSLRTASNIGVGKPHQDKVWIRAHGLTERVFAQLPAEMPLNFFWTASHDADTQLIIGINSDPRLDVREPGRVSEVIHSYLPEITEVSAVVAHSWSSDPYARGGNGIHRPNTTTHLRELQRPHGRLSFATADIASGWFGYMDGAIESGVRAARQCIDRAD